MTQRTWDEIRDEVLGPDGDQSLEYKREMIALEFGDFIRRAREGAELTQRQLGDRLQISQPAVARLEAGRSLPKVDTLTRLAEALHGRLSVQLVVEDSEGGVTELAATPLGWTP